MDQHYKSVCHPDENRDPFDRSIKQTDADLRQLDKPETKRSAFKNHPSKLSNQLERNNNTSKFSSNTLKFFYRTLMLLIVFITEV